MVRSEKEKAPGILETHLWPAVRLLNNDIAASANVAQELWISLPTFLLAIRIDQGLRLLGSQSRRDGFCENLDTVAHLLASSVPKSNVLVAPGADLERARSALDGSQVARKRRA